MFGPDYLKLAEAYGIPAYRATLTDEVGDVIKKMFETEGPVLAEFKVVKEDNVYPMIPAGQTYNEIMDIPDEVNASQDEITEELELVTTTKG
jgi:acetolactate synthase-1/2/3 large subunit